MIVNFGRKFELGGKIGGGSFGEIFHTKNVKTGEDVAAKIEMIINRESSSQLRREAKIYHLLRGSSGIPKVRWFGDLGDKYIMVMDLLGKSLEDLFNYCNRSFTLKTVLVLGYELMCRIETVHAKGHLIHRDIKPENFLLGRGRERHTVYIIDFGLAKLYKNPENGKHISCREGHSLTGTARYASVNAHNGLEQSRRDDLFSVGYVLLYFLRGSLPWQGLKAESSHDKYQLILEKKLSTSIEKLCYGLPEEFLLYFQYINSLGFEDTPDYTYLKNLFKDLFHRMKYEYDQILFDWEVLLVQQKQQQNNENR